MQKILFPTDFSPTAKNAFIYALHLTNKIGGSITTLHAYEPPDIRGVVMPNLVSEIQQSIKMEEFDEYQHSVSELRAIADANLLGHVPMDHLLKKGSGKRAILTTAEREGFELIVMGTKGASGLKEVFIGSVTGEVMEKATCPVLAIPDEAVFDHNIDQMAVTTEFSEEDEKAMLHILKFASMFDHTKLTVLHVGNNGESENAKKLQALQNKYSDRDRLQFKLLESFDIYKALNEYLEENHIDIVAMLTHERNFFQELFNYSRAKKMIYHSKIPLLAIPARSLI